MIIAIDGPAGSGKSTIARLLSEKLDLPYIDTGAFYRCAALHSLRNPGSSEKDISLFVNEMRIRIGTPNDPAVIILNDEDVSEKIRTPQIAMEVSNIADMKNVRIEINNKLRASAEATGGILEGRDIQTLVCPQADVKFFLTATPETRAKRRLGDYEGMKIDKTPEEVLADIKRRDKRDYQRDYGPLKKADDAVEVDTSDMTLSQVVDRMLEIIRGS
ncbi:(d)CMP kinase [bacterium]|nr:(d)CMP kinase [bacterium]